MPLWDRITNEPVLLTAAITAVINALAAFSVVTVTEQQLGVVNVAVVAVLALFTRSRVTPV